MDPNCVPDKDSATEEFNTILNHSLVDDNDKQNDKSNESSVVTPFLVKHISDSVSIPNDNYHRYCYRHNPDVSRNRQIDVNKMHNIQNGLEELPHRDQEAISHVWSIFSAAPSHHRKLILQGILSQCCFPTLSYVSSEVSSLIKVDFISALPLEISLKILCYLDCASLCNAAQVSKTWKALADDDRVWHHMCEQHIDRKCPNCGWGLPLMHMKRAREEYELRSQSQNEQLQNEQTQQPQSQNEQTQSLQTQPPQSSQNPQTQQPQTQNPQPQTQPPQTQPPKRPNHSEVEHDLKRFKSHHQMAIETAKNLKKRPWKSVYSERYKLEKNWRKGTHSSLSFIGHTDGITCLQFDRKHLITSSYDATIKIWNIESGQCIRTLTGHTRGIRSLVFDNQKLISAGLDSTIKVWNYHNGQCISTYRGHDDAVVSVDFLDKTIVSGSADNTVKVWHVDSRTCYTLRGHSDWVNSVKIHAPSNVAFSASDDTSVRMWDLESHKCIRVFGGLENDGHIGQVQCVIPFTYKDQLVKDEIGDNSQGSRSSTRSSEQEEDEFVFNPKYPTHLLTSSLDNTIKLWDVNSGKCIRTQFGHIEGVWSISSDNFRIISGAHDRLVKVWDLQDGKCLHTWSNDSSVSCVGLSDSSFAVGLENGIVKMYLFEGEVKEKH